MTEESEEAATDVFQKACYGCNARMHWQTFLLGILVLWSTKGEIVFGHLSGGVEIRDMQLAGQLQLGNSRGDFFISGEKE